jgi:hypothetical protein
MPTTLHMVPHSGRSTDESNTPPASLLGERVEVIGNPSPDPYKAITDACYMLLTQKRNYYGCGQDPLSNAMGVKEDGIAPDVYQLARIGEKRRRLQGQLSMEDRIETFMDIMGHAAVAIACLRNSDSKQS